MRGSFLVRVAMAGSMLLAVGVFARCVDPYERCSQLRTCGDKTLSFCSNESDCRYKSSDGHSWSCSGTTSSNDYAFTCQTTSCQTAAQEAVDWCFAQGSGTGGTAGIGGATGLGGSGGSSRP